MLLTLEQQNEVTKLTQKISDHYKTISAHSSAIAQARSSIETHEARMRNAGLAVEELKAELEQIITGK